jgi:exopolysaccharide biosynthesis polyprenyl glycosylphosphotransferase
MSTAYPMPEETPISEEIEEVRVTGSGRRSRVATVGGRHLLVGYAVLAWTVAFTVLSISMSLDLALGEATLLCAIWTLLSHRVALAFRAMTFVIGPLVLAAVTSTIGVAAISVVGYWFPPVHISRSLLLFVALTITFASGVWGYALQRVGRVPTRVLIVGGGGPTVRLLDDLDREPEALFEVVAVVADSCDPRVARRVPYGGRIDGLSQAVRTFSPDLVVVAVARDRPQVFTQLLAVADAGFKMVGLPEIYESAFGRLPIEDLTAAWFMSVLHAYNRPASRVLKRGFDITVSFVGIVVVLPFLPLFVVVLKMTRGPLLYRQQRLGEHAQLFTMLKFRSMRVDAEAPGQALWAMKNDPRVIPGGRVMRLLRLDELPQLWNVLKGDMSIVGPRPERPEFIEQLNKAVPFWTQRHLLKPGITGWAQIRAGYAADALATTEKLSYDFWYLRHRSILLDAIICLKTVPRAIMCRGAR